MNLNKFLRRDGIVGGVAGGLAHALDVPAWMVRLGLFISFFTSFGITFLCYIAAVFSFPTEMHYRLYGDGPKALGVCYSIAPRLDISPSWVRFFVLIATLLTGFFPVPVLYVVAHLFLTGKEGGVHTTRKYRDVN